MRTETSDVQNYGRSIIIRLGNLSFGFYKGYNDLAGNQIGSWPILAPIIAGSAYQVKQELNNTTGYLERVRESNNKNLVKIIEQEERKLSKPKKSIRGIFVGATTAGIEVGIGYLFGAVIQKISSMF